MSTLKDKAQEILDEKIAKIKPENIKKDIQIFDVTGILDEELPTLDITVPNSIDIDLSTENQTVVFENTAYIPDVKVLLKLFAREKTSEDEWKTGIIGNIQELGVVFNRNNKLTISFNIWFLEDIDDYDFKIDMMFVKNNYLPQTSSIMCNLIKPNGAKLQLHMESNSHSSIKGVITDPNDIVITDENDVVIDNLTKLYEDDYWTDTFIISLLPIGNYKVKLNHNGSEISNMNFSITETDMKVNNKFTKTLYYAIDDIYTFKGEIKYNNPYQENEQQLLHFAKCKLTRQDSDGQPISKEVQISPYIAGQFILDGAKQLEVELNKPGYETQLYTYSNNELSEGPYYIYQMAQTFDSTTHNSIDIVIGPWEDEQAGTTSAAPDDLDISIYLQNDNDEYVLVDDESIGYYVSNSNENLSAVVVFGKMNQNVKLVLNDSRYKFSQQEESEHEAIRSINEWGYTIGLYPVE